MAKLTRKQAVIKAAKAHTNLNTFASLVSILEGGHIYGGSPRSDSVARRIIVLCQREQSALLRDYDKAVVAASSEPSL